MPSEIYLTINEVSKRVADRVLFNSVSFGIHQFDKYGVIGVNGSGKSTFLNIIAGLDYPSTGSIIPRKNLTIGYLPQIPNLNLNNDILTEVLINLPFSKDKLWEYEHKAKALLTKLNLHEFEKPVFLLSGGQKRKLDLARVILKNPEILLLDEPTNHLDLDTIEWLQDYLIFFKGAILFVTHDRYFLDAVCNKILEIENKQINIFDGGYSIYVEGAIQKQIDNQRKEIRRKAQLKKELDWLKRGAKARTSKPKHHIDRVKELLSKSYLISNQELDISFQIKKQGKTILELHNISKCYDGKILFKQLEHNFQARERIGIIGPNGCGKTTLLRMMAGEETPDEGSVKKGIHTIFAYYKQDQEDMQSNLSVIDYVNQYSDVIRTADGHKFSASEMLQRFLFDSKMQQMKVSALSGGEKKRLHLLVSLMQGSNFLIMDEPTNDLDIRTLEILEDYLDAYQGCIVVVSHDRYFLDRICDYLFIFETNGIRKFVGNYSDYLLLKRYRETENKINDTSLEKVSYKNEHKTKKLTWKEKQELLSLEDKISKLENELLKLEKQLSSEYLQLSYKEYHNIADLIDNLKKQLDDSMHKWIELAEKESDEKTIKE